MIKVACYCRVSTVEQTNGYSIPEQQERMTKYCDAMGWSVYNVYTDAGFTGSNLDRNALKSMLADISSHKVDKVLVYKLDRLSRSQKDTLYLIEDCFLANNVDFVSMSENFDTSTPFGKAMIGILSVFAQLEREQIKERMALGKNGRAKEGLYHGGGYIPIGYDYIDGQLIINEYEALQIREMHQLFQEGKSICEIERIMNKKGYTHKHGKWYHKSIKYALTNNLYMGIIKWQGIEHRGSHVPIIDEETFNKTQIEYKARNNRPRHYQRTTLLGGLLFCRNCGARYGTNRQRNGDKLYRYYTCYSRSKIQQSMIRDRNCKNKIWKMQELDDIVLNEIKKLASDETAISEIAKNNDSEKRNLIEKEIEKIDTQKSRFMDLYGIGNFTIDELNDKIIPLDERKKKLEQELKNTPNGMSEKETIETLATFEDVIEGGDFERIRLLINALIDKIELDNEDVYIYWRFS